MNKNLYEKYKEDPDEVLKKELFDVIERTRSTTEKMEAIKMIISLRDDHIC